MKDARDFDWNACNHSAEFTFMRDGLLWDRGLAFCRLPKHDGDNHVFEFSGTYTMAYGTGTK